MSNNGLILHVTAAGRAQRTTCRLDHLPLPRFSGWVVDTAAEQNIDAPTLQPLYTSSQGGETLIERIDVVAIGVRILIPADFAGWVRGIALLTEDGTVYAYCRFAPENGGMYKPAGTAIRQLLILAEDGRETVEFTYSVVDISTLVADMTDDVYAAALERLGVATGVDVYTHPTTHPSSIIEQSPAARFVTDADILAWNNKANADHAHAEATETVIGFARFATQAEVIAGDSVNASIRPADLHLKLSLAMDDVDSRIPFLITPPSVSRAAAATGQPVPLTAAGSQYLWGGSSGITYIWELPDGNVATGSTLSAAVGDSLAVTAVDNIGNRSIAVAVDISASVSTAGTSGPLAPGGTRTVLIPDGATMLTLTGKGGKGAVATQTTFSANYKTSSTALAVPVLTTSNLIGPAPSTWNTASPPVRVSYDGGYHNFLSATATTFKYVLASSETNYPVLTVVKTAGTAATAGTATTITGAVTASFAGAATGVTTAPATTVQTKVLPAGTNRSVTVVIPASGAMTLDWS